MVASIVVPEVRFEGVVRTEETVAYCFPVAGRFPIPLVTSPRSQLLFFPESVWISFRRSHEPVGSPWRFETAVMNGPAEHASAKAGHARRWFEDIREIKLYSETLWRFVMDRVTELIAKLNASAEAPHQTGGTYDRADRAEVRPSHREQQVGG